MKIQTRLLLIFSLAALSLSWFAVASYFTAQAATSSLKKSDISRNIIRAVFELNVARGDYQFYHEPRAWQQWHNGHASLMKDIEAADRHFRSRREKQALNAIRMRLAMMQQYFVSLQQIREREIEAAWRGQLVEKSQENVRYASELAKITREQMLDWIRNFVFITLVFLINMLLLITWAYRVVLIHIIHPIETMRRGVTRISDGDLHHQIALNTRDELGYLSRAFDDLASHLVASNERLEEKINLRTVELRQANENLRKMDALKTNFIAIASHELKTPLTAMKGFLNLVLDGKESAKIPKPQAEMLRYVKEGSDRMQRLIDSLLNISKIELGQMPMRMHDGVDPAKILKDTVISFRQQFLEKDISIQEEFGEDIRPLRADEDRLREVFENLITNALKYTPRGGGVWVNVKNRGESVEISVKDTGIGIREEDLEHIFEPFHHLQKTGLEGEESTGLGLALVKKIVEVHGGAIGVRSIPSKGSVFTVSLPAMKPAAVS